MKMKSLSHVRLLATPWTAAHQAPPSMGFSRQEHWSGVPLSSPILLKQVDIKPGDCVWGKGLVSYSVISQGLTWTSHWREETKRHSVENDVSLCPLEMLAPKCSSQATLIEVAVQTEGDYSPALLHHELVVLHHERQDQIWAPHGLSNEDSTKTGENPESCANMWNSWRSSKQYILGGEKNWKGHEHSFQVSEGLLHMEGKSFSGKPREQNYEYCMDTTIKKI